MNQYRAILHNRDLYVPAYIESKGYNRAKDYIRHYYKGYRIVSMKKQRSLYTKIKILVRWKRR